MLDETLAERYSEALYKMAHEAGKAGAQLKELQHVGALMDEHRQLRHALESPAVPREVKRNIARQLLQGHVGQDTLHFLYLVIDKGREKYFPAMIRSFEKRLQEDEGIVEARVEVPAPLEAAEEAAMRQRLSTMTGKKVQMEVKVRPELLAGAVITVGDRLFDGSLKTQLEQIRERLIHS